MTKRRKEMKIIDFEKKGNVVRFYLGEKTPDWGWTNKDYKDGSGKTPDWLKPSETYYGDDWDDAPYEHNAGPVYDEFVKGHRDIAFPFDDLVLEPCDGESESPYCKEDFVAMNVPCIIVVPAEIAAQAERPWDDYLYWLGHDGVRKYYYGDEMEACE